MDGRTFGIPVIGWSVCGWKSYVSFVRPFNVILVSWLVSQSNDHLCSIAHHHN